MNGTAIQQVLVRHFAGGDALFTVLTVLVLAAAGGLFIRRAWALRCARFAGLLGAAIVTLSAMPLPIWLYAAGGVLWLVWIACLGREGRKLRNATAASLILCCAAASAIEIAFRFQPFPTERPFRRLAVIGDSLSAAVSAPGERTWPARFGDATGVELLDVSRAGATARSALDQALALGDEPALVLVEIGGNDLFAGRTSGEFGHDLDRLLRTIARPDREIVLLELPLPPFCNGYGIAQRKLAAQYGAAVIPRRELARVLLSNWATLDDLHLSNADHQAMAEMIARLLEGRFVPAGRQ